MALSVGEGDERRSVRAFARILGCSEAAARQSIARPPFSVKRGLSHEDASFGQFELISCDSVSVILTDQVIDGATQEYLDELYEELLRSPEFEVVALRIVSVPQTERGLNYIDQFVGNDPTWRTDELKVHRKKARIMRHWAEKIGGNVTVYG